MQTVLRFPGEPEGWLKVCLWLGDPEWQLLIMTHERKGLCNSVMVGPACGLHNSGNLEINCVDLF